MFSVLFFLDFYGVFFFQWFFNGLHGSHDSLARILHTLNSERTAHFLADFFAIIARLTFSSKRAMWSSPLISKIFCLRSSRLQFRRNYWYWGSTIKKSNFLRVALCLNHKPWNPCEIKVHYQTKTRRDCVETRSTIFPTFGLALFQFFRLVSFPRGILDPERIDFERDVRIYRLQAV